MTDNKIVRWGGSRYKDDHFAINIIWT